MPSTYEQFREAVLKAASPEHKAEILELKWAHQTKLVISDCLLSSAVGRQLSFGQAIGG